MPLYTKERPRRSTRVRTVREARYARTTPKTQRVSKIDIYKHGKEIFSYDRGHYMGPLSWLITMDEVYELTLKMLNELDRSAETPILRTSTAPAAFVANVVDQDFVPGLWGGLYHFHISGYRIAAIIHSEPNVLGLVFEDRYNDVEGYYGCCIAEMAGHLRAGGIFTWSD